MTLMRRFRRKTTEGGRKNERREAVSELLQMASSFCGCELLPNSVSACCVSECRGFCDLHNLFTVLLAPFFFPQRRPLSLDRLQEFVAVRATDAMHLSRTSVQQSNVQNKTVQRLTSHMAGVLLMTRGTECVLLLQFWRVCR